MLDDDLSIPAFLRRTNPPTQESDMPPEDTQVAKTPPQPTIADLEHDIARLCREVQTIDAHLKSQKEKRAAKMKEIKSKTDEMIDIRLKTTIAS